MDISPEPDLELGEVEQSEVDFRKRARQRKPYKPAVRVDSDGEKEETSDGYPPISSVWAQVQEKNESKNYNFERFEALQLLNLCLMQYELRKLADDIYTTIGDTNVYPSERMGDRPERLKAMLKEYNEALTALHTVMSFPKAAFGTISKEYDTPKIAKVPLLMTDLRKEEEEDGLRKIVRKWIPKKAKESNWLSTGPRKELKTGLWQNLRGYTKARAKEHEDDGLTTLVDNLTRTVLALFAGASLLAPMIIMIFSKSRNANLIITSVFVLFFGLVLSFGSKASNQEILTATAGYAAVLVVFIGTSGGGSS